MGVYCFDISPHEVQHAAIPAHIVTTTDLIQIHAPNSPNKCILSHSTHTHLESECENEAATAKAEAALEASAETKMASAVAIEVARAPKAAPAVSLAAEAVRGSTGGNS